MRLIKIKDAKRIIFVGDTHGDLEASQKVIKDYLKPGNKIVFLGDYVDRGPYSKENLDFLLEIKAKKPNQIYLLQGNHEGHHILKFSPALNVLCILVDIIHLFSHFKNNLPFGF